MEHAEPRLLARAVLSNWKVVRIYSELSPCPTCALLTAGVPVLYTWNYNSHAERQQKIDYLKYEGLGV
jgi:hypothetical protein